MSETPAPEQTTYARALAQELLDCGHDDISYLDLLDSLTSCGLMLVMDLETEVPREYLAEMNHQMAIATGEKEPSTGELLELLDQQDYGKCVLCGEYGFGVSEESDWVCDECP